MRTTTAVRTRPGTRRSAATAALGLVALAALTSPHAASAVTQTTTKAPSATKAAAPTKKPTATTKAAAATKAPVTTKAPATTAAPVTLAPAKAGSVKLGFFPNVTHATGLVAVQEGFFQKALGPEVKLETFFFNAGPPEMEALVSGALDAAYVGPNPAINSFTRSNGQALRIIAGAADGGASFIVKPSIGSVNDLKGKKFATPNLGGTQDVALRSWLKSKGLSTTLEGGGDVSVIPQENAQTLETFRSGQIDGAWVPEPWATRLILEGGGRVLVDERDIWPGQVFTTTILVVRTDFLKERPDLVERLLQGQVNAVDWMKANPGKAQDAANAQIEKATGRKLAANVISNSWVNLTFTNDPLMATFKAGAQKAKDVGLLDKVALDGIDDLTILNKVLARSGKAKIA